MEIVAKTSPAFARGDRLNPMRDDRLYWHLTAMRRAYEDAIERCLASRKSDVLLDFGCGNMPYKSLFNVQKYVGADFPGNEQADVFVTEKGTLPIADRSISVVLSSQVLEHVADVELYLNESRRVLNAQGLLFLSTHGTWRYHPDPCDFWRWTCDGLRRVITSAKFEIIDFRGVMGPAATALQLWQDATSNRVPQSLRRWFFRYLQWRIERADKQCSDRDRDRDACIYVLVAKKIED